MTIFKCKMCGGNLEIQEGLKIIECDYCGAKQTLPNTKDENLQTLFNRANLLRMKGEFDKAEQIYEKILHSNEQEAEAYWGLILCKYGIEYVEDPVTFKRVPTCHRASFESVTADEDYKMALLYADFVQKDIYEAEAKAIDAIQKGILSISKNEKPYDVFICYKETDEVGNRTIDSTIANDIYYQLTQEGFKVFYAAITLEDKLGQEYEPYIFAALNSSKVMLTIGTKPEYFNAVWVKNEWSRFLKIMKADRSKILIPCYRNMDAYELPEEFAHLQAQDMSKIGFVNDVIRGIKKVTQPIECATKNTKETIAVSGNSNIAPLLQRAFMFLEDGDWNSANEYCEKVLDIDPECAEAYLGKMMAELKVQKQEDLKDCAFPFNRSKNYEKAVRFADDKLKIDLNGYIDYINDRNEKARVDGIYNRAVNTMSAATTENGYKEAAGLFETVREYLDSATLEQTCYEKAEIARKETERIDKKKKKTALITGPIVCAIIIFTIVLKIVIIPNSKYNNAIALLDAGNIVEAYEALVELDGYKDSDDIAKSIYGKYKVKKLKIDKVGDYIFLGKYEQDNNTSNGEEDIEWLILEVKDGRALVISKYALDCRRYNSSHMNVTWEDSSLREWLNNDFINDAFLDDERAVIPTVNVVSDKNPEYDTNPGNTTQDQVFLLSINEVSKYFNSTSASQCMPTEYTVAGGEYVKQDNGNCWWWLRSPGDDQDRAAIVLNYGHIHLEGGPVSKDNVAVRPALWIDLNP